MITELEAALRRNTDPRYPHPPGGEQTWLRVAFTMSLLYHMVVSDLYAAGCPTGKRLTQFPGWPGRDEADSRIKEALPYLKHIQNTSSFWGVRIILRELYGWTAAIAEGNWQKLDAYDTRAAADDRAQAHSVLDRAQRIQPHGHPELARRGKGEDDDRLQYALEWGFFTRTQWGEFDTALYELERCWGKSRCSRARPP